MTDHWLSVVPGQGKDPLPREAPLPTDLRRIEPGGLVPIVLSAPLTKLGTVFLFTREAAIRLSRLRYDLFRLILADEILRQERFDRVRNRGNVLAMIFPRSARSRTAARRELVDAAPVCVHNDAGRCARTLIQGVRYAIEVFVGLTGERERRVKRSLAGDVRPDAQPIRRQSVIANPALQITGEQRRGGRFGRGKPQEIPVAQQH